MNDWIMHVVVLMIDPSVAGQCANAKASRGGWHTLLGQVRAEVSLVTGDPRNGRGRSLENAKPPAGTFIMKTEAKIFKEKLCYGECDHCEGVGTDMHICPYAEDIYGDSREICNCCHSCTYECAQDI